MCKQQNNRSDFCDFAMSLFSDIGYTEYTAPIYQNCNVEELLYQKYDSYKLLNKNQHKVLKSLRYISCLFVLDESFFDKDDGEAIYVFAVEYDCSSKDRSAMACDLHMIINQISSSRNSIIIYKHENNISISLCNYKIQNTMSDWFSIDDVDDFKEKLHVTNLRCDNAKHFLSDLISFAGREYYTNPLTKNSGMNELFPDDYLLYKNGNVEVMHDKEYIEKNMDLYMNKYVYSYGDDYVEPIENDDSANEIDEMDSYLLEMDYDDVDDLALTDSYSSEKSEESEIPKSEEFSFSEDEYNDAALMLKRITKNNLL